MSTRMTTVLRQLLRSGKTLVKPGAYNALSARIIEQSGFPTVGVSGYGVSASLLGKPDVGLLTLNEMVMASRYIVGAVNIPVIADADTGYGNAINAMRTTEDFIRAGVAAIHIEDQVAPKRCGHVAGKQVVPVEEAVGKYRAAARARDDLDPDFVLIARTDARGAPGGSVEEVIRRGNAYLEAGADMIFPEGLVSAAEVEQVCREVHGPIHYNRTGVSPLLPLDELNRIGVAMVSNATGTLRASARAMWDYMAAFMAEDVEHQKRFLAENEGHPTDDFHGFMGFPEFRRLEEDFLPAEDVLAKYDGSIGYRPPASGGA